MNILQVLATEEMTQRIFTCSRCETNSLLIPPKAFAKAFATRSPAGHGNTRNWSIQPKAFHIDHRHHMNLAWERQAKEDELLLPTTLQNDINKAGAVLPVKNLHHLELLLEAAGGRLAILTLYSASCGVCKETRRVFQQLCAESHRQLARTVFLEHDVFDEFDSPSDLARLYRIKSVPQVLFFIDGALVRRFSMADVRSVIRSSSMEMEQRHLKALIFELLVKNAPGARR